MWKEIELEPAPNDETAEKLLKCILEEKQKLENYNKKIKD